MKNHNDRRYQAKRNKVAMNLHFREMKSVPFTASNPPNEFILFFEQTVWPKLKSLHKGYNIAKKKIIAVQVVHSLIETGLTEKVVADSRNWNDKQARKRIPIWDACVREKLCHKCKGSQMSGKVTRYRATDKLLEIRELWELRLLERLELKWNTEEAKPTRYALVVLYSGDKDWRGQTLPEEERKKPISLKERIAQQVGWLKYHHPHNADCFSVEYGMEHFRKIENKINEINIENLSHTWKAYRISEETGNIVAFQPNVCLRQVHSGDLWRAVRLYSWGSLSGQGMSKEQRRTIEIDDEPAAEIDSHCHHIRMLYHFRGIDERGDVYYPERIFKKYYDFENVSDDKRKTARTFIKTCTTICLNTGSKNEALQAIGNVLAHSSDKGFLNNLIWNVEKINLHGILDRLIAAHPKKVSKSFFTNIGTELLMTTDGNIMLHSLDEFVRQNKNPALAIHDSLIVRRSDIDLAKDIFTNNYTTFMQFPPVLKQEF